MCGIQVKTMAYYCQTFETIPDPQQGKHHLEGIKLLRSTFIIRIMTFWGKIKTTLTKGYILVTKLELLQKVTSNYQ